MFAVVLGEAANSVRRHSSEYGEYYLKKYAEATKHQHKRALALTSRKLVRLVFGLLAKNQLYTGNGGYKIMVCIENTSAWDGAVPYVIGSPVSLPNTITLHAQGQRCLRRVFGRIVDAADVTFDQERFSYTFVWCMI